MRNYNYLNNKDKQTIVKLLGVFVSTYKEAVLIGAGDIAAGRCRGKGTGVPMDNISADQEVCNMERCLKLT